MASLENTALVLIGYQNDYFHEDGVLYQVIEESAKATQVVKNTVKLLQDLIETPLHILMTPIIFTPNYEELSNPVGILQAIKEANAFQAGSHGAETISEILTFGDRIKTIPGKRGFNAFIGTKLEAYLKENNIEHVVIAGAVTSICIDSTARSAHEKHYNVTILSDCISARTNFEQEFYLENVFPLYAETRTANEFIEALTVTNAR